MLWEQQLAGRGVSRFTQREKLNHSACTMVASTEGNFGAGVALLNYSVTSKQGSWSLYPSTGMWLHPSWRHNLGLTASFSQGQFLELEPLATNISGNWGKESLGLKGDLRITSSTTFMWKRAFSFARTCLCISNLDNHPAGWSQKVAILSKVLKNLE